MTDVLDWSRLIGFSSNPLDRRSELRGDATLIASARADTRAGVHVFAGEDILLDNDGKPLALTAGHLRDYGADLDGALLLGWMPDGAPRFAIDVKALEAFDGMARTDLRSLAISGEAGDGILGQAKALMHWHNRHGFCSNCGTPTVMTMAGYRRDCPSCQAQHFPRVDPVVIMLIADGERILLGRQARFKAGSYSCLAGFLEPGETVEDAVRRETFEEAGVRVGKVRYHASQPWPFPHSLMIGCIGEATTTDLVIDRNELEDCRWFERAEVAQMLTETHPDGLFCPPKLAIARHLVEAWMR